MSKQNQPIKLTRKPRKCPKCGNSPVASIIYGMPDFSEKLEQELAEGSTTLGGCCIEIDGHVWECSQCKLKIYKKEKT